MILESYQGMELRHLRYFVAVAEEMSFRGAAIKLRVAQPALSVQIRKLEAEIGAELLLRDGGRFKLSEAGLVFLERARQTLNHANHSIALARQAANGEIGELSIGYNMPTGFRVFPKILPAFKKQWPNVHLTFNYLKIPEQLDGLRREKLDLGFIWLPIPLDEFDVHALMKVPVIAVLPAGHRLASSPSVSIKSLSKEPLVLVSRIQDPETFHAIEQTFASAHAQMNVAYELENSLSMINFVAMELGCSLLPDYVRMIPRKGVVYRPLSRNPIIKTLAVVKLKGRGGLTESMFRFTVDKFAPSGNHRR